jgi:acyl carrier protein
MKVSNESDDQIIEVIDRIFREVLNLEVAVDLNLFKYGASGDLDSLAFMEIVVNIELVLGISFQAEDLGMIKCFADFVNCAIEARKYREDLK